MSEYWLSIIAASLATSAEVAAERRDGLYAEAVIQIRDIAAAARKRACEVIEEEQSKE